MIRPNWDLFSILRYQTILNDGPWILPVLSVSALAIAGWVTKGMNNENTPNGRSIWNDGSSRIHVRLVRFKTSRIDLEDHMGNVYRIPVLLSSLSWFCKENLSFELRSHFDVEFLASHLKKKSILNIKSNYCDYWINFFPSFGARILCLASLV